MLIDCPNGCHEGSFECKVLTVSCPTTQMYGSGGAAGAFTCRKCGGSGYRKHTQPVGGPVVFGVGGATVGARSTLMTSANECEISSACNGQPRLIISPNSPQDGSI
jgi:hypothetical protein